MNRRLPQLFLQSGLLLVAISWPSSRALAFQSDAQFTARGYSWHSTGEGWTATEDYWSDAAFPDRADEETLKSIRIEWGALERDALGNYCTVRGRLTVPGDEPGTRRPIDWFQGITVYLAKAPDAAPDWSHGMDQNDTAWDNTVVRPGKEFEATFDLREIGSDRAKTETFQFAVALAQHKLVERGVQRVTWSSQSAAIASSVQKLNIPAAPKLSPELIAINAAAGWAARNPNGATLIRAVNALQRIGKERALALLEEYLKLTDTPDERYDSDERDVVFWIVRLLFEPIRPDERIPFPEIFVSPITSDPAREANWPLDPIAVVDDIPFMVGSRHGFFNGVQEPPANHIRWARRNGVIRDRELKSTTNPLHAADALLKSTRFLQVTAGNKFLREMMIKSIRVQAASMLEGIVALPERWYREEGKAKAEWQRRLRIAAKLKIEWDAKTERFVVRK